MCLEVGRIDRENANKRINQFLVRWWFYNVNTVGGLRNVLMFETYQQVKFWQQTYFPETVFMLFLQQGQKQDCFLGSSKYILYIIYSCALG